MQNAINWFEIPVSDMERAAAFYSAILGKALRVTEVRGIPYAFFPYEYEKGAVGGALAQGDDYQPSQVGTMVYLAMDDVNTAVEQVEAAGGTVLVPKSSLGDEGFFAIMVDTEGNKVGLHSRH